MLELRITPAIGIERNGRCTYAHDRDADFAAAIWIVDPACMLDLAHQQLLEQGDGERAKEEAYFAGARLRDDELGAAAAEDEQRRPQARQRGLRPSGGTSGLARDIRVGPRGRRRETTGDRGRAIMVAMSW